MNDQHQGQTASAILVIEDNAAQLKTLTDILETEGLQPIACLSGREALETCRRHDVHVAILDLNLPEMNGLEVLTQLKQQVPDMKVIINTAYATLESAMEAVNKEAFAYVQKMGDVEELLTHIHRAFHVHLAGYSEQLEEEVSKRTAELSIANDALRQEIEERTRMSEEIRTLNEELELRVRQRTSELELANRELKDFTYIVSHDLKAPLRGIRRIAEWLLEDYTELFDESGKEMPDLLMAKVQRMHTLIDGILQYSRVGRLVREEEHIELNVLVPEIINMFTLPEHVQIRIVNTLPAIFCDKILIGLMFQNLLANGIACMDKPNGMITISCENNGDMWLFRVSDNGSGIKTRDQKKIFQIFQTVAPHDEPESKGIGLAIVKKIVELYGGTIRVESTPGKGSIFSFTLPGCSHSQNS